MSEQVTTPHQVIVNAVAWMCEDIAASFEELKAADPADDESINMTNGRIIGLSDAVARLVGHPIVIWGDCSNCKHVGPAYLPPARCPGCGVPIAITNELWHNADHPLNVDHPLDGA